MARNRSTLGNQRNKKTGKNKYKQGTYPIQNPNKYIGQLPVLFRSSWEFAFCKFCDLSDTVVKWSSESLEIQYNIINSSGVVETHRYYPDFYVEMIDNSNPDKYDRLVIEIKPKKETDPPAAPVKQSLKMLENYEYSLKTFKTNLHKWAFAKEWCERRNLKFIIITEEDLRKRGLIP